MRIIDYKLSIKNHQIERYLNQDHQSKITLVNVSKLFNLFPRWFKLLLIYFIENLDALGEEGMRRRIAQKW